MAWNDKQRGSVSRLRAAFQLFVHERDTIYASLKTMTIFEN